ncbi:hypothetical protein FE374_18100 [Georgenia yuyongxinii]|uniref:histidine kinase n=1 Tax=Georgenia yuyongxinii TaxID=2589797 RepID=A0A5B8CDJ7_9MICO|nr:GAF domain-containing sensor histidine kinase [Georgenia yuyongxinii]QDC26266.1 hypothetical protein FE374_18100 [Georgenia yuyongxinii]
MNRAAVGVVLGIDAVASLLVVVTLVTMPASAESPGARVTQLAFVLGTLGLAVVGALVVLRRPDQHHIGWLLLTVGALGGAGRAVTALALLDPARTGAGLAWVTNWAWVPGTTAVLLLLLRLPTGVLPRPRWRWVERAVLGWGGVTLVVTAVVPGPLAVTPLGRDNPVGIVSAPWLTDLLTPVFLALQALVVVCASALVARYRQADTEERAQLRWVGAAVAILAVAAPLAAISSAWAVVEGAAYLLLPAGLTVAVLRHRLYDLGLVVRRTLVHGVAAALLMALYVATVTAGQALLRGWAPDVLAAAVVAVAAVPVLTAVRRGTERLIFGDRHDPDRVASELAERLSATPQALLPQVAEEVGRTLRLPYVAIELSDGTVAACWPGHGSDAEGLRVPLRHAGKTVGHLVAGRRSPAERLDGRDRQLLERVAAHAGLAVHSALLTVALHRTTERLRLARADERVRLQRDLHDELGPALGAIAMRAEAARNLVRSGTDPALVDDVLAGVQDGAEVAVAEVRRILAELPPQVLQEQGLVAALEHVARTAPPGLRVELEVEELGALPPAVELAMYRLAAEAMRNVVRHAGATTATVRVRRSADEVELLVVDDGVGLPGQPLEGVGLGSMRARAAQLGGRLEIRAARGNGEARHAAAALAAATGTVVHALIPLEQP